MPQKKSQFIRPITAFNNRDLMGEKSQGIKFLLNNRYSVPTTYVCSTEAYDKHLQCNCFLSKLLEKEIESNLDLNQYYSIRSSATIEDMASHSFAGQFKSFLNVKGKTNILESIKKVWESTNTDYVKSYSRKSHINIKNLKMAVIIQEMVKAKASGVVFTKNPMNNKDEVIIEAVRGLGDSLLQDGVNPYRGVYKWGAWVEKPNLPSMPLRLLEEIAIKSKILESKKRKPLNLEWSYDGHCIYWLQLREITTLTHLPFYSNKMAKEFLPGIIKPLIWSVNIPIVCGAWTNLLSEILNELKIEPKDLARQFYYRAYFNMGVIGRVFDEFGMPREGLEVLMGYGINAPDKPSLKLGLKSLKYLPNLIRFSVDKIFFDRKMRKFIQHNDQEIKKILKNPLATMNKSDTVATIEKLFRYNKKAAYFVIVSQLLNAVYNRILMNMLEKKAKRLEDINLMIENYQDIDPNLGIYELHKKYMRLSKKDKKILKSFFANREEGTQNVALINFRIDFEDFIEKFGHLSDQGNDFSNVTWKEQPLLLLNMVINYDSIRHLCRTQNASEKPIISGLLLNLVYKRVKESLKYKERISFNYLKSYGLFRKYFLYLSKLFKSDGYYNDLDDVFYLTFDEIKKIVRDNIFSKELDDKIIERKKQITNYKDIELPEVIYSNQAPTPIRKGFNVKSLVGIPASNGYYSGKTCVVKGIQDFSKVISGDVVIIPFSDISWTPILTKAGAVVSESGGILSHSAIITREHGIPCVVGVPGACKLDDGKKIHVDGFSGKITVEQLT